MEVDYSDINIERLRNDLLDYFTGAYFIASPLAIKDMDDVENANDLELINLALENGFKLSNYLNFYHK